jgi:signal transduction histidine kinase
MKRLCSDLRIFSGSLAINKQIDDLGLVIQASAEGFASDTGRIIEVDLKPLPKVLIDKQEVIRLIHNLLLNAHEATAADGSIALKASNREDMIEISIIDSGEGISMEFQKNGLFLPFHTTKSDGLGIGLFHCKKIVEAHGGRIEVASEEGRGTTVRIFFPVEIAASSNVTPSSADAPHGNR